PSRFIALPAPPAKRLRKLSSPGERAMAGLEAPASRGKQSPRQGGDGLWEVGTVVSSKRRRAAEPMIRVQCSAPATRGTEYSMSVRMHPAVEESEESADGRTHCQTEEIEDSTAAPSVGLGHTTLLVEAQLDHTAHLPVGDLQRASLRQHLQNTPSMPDLVEDLQCTSSSRPKEHLQHATPLPTELLQLTTRLPSGHHQLLTPPMEQPPDTTPPPTQQHQNPAARAEHRQLATRPLISTLSPPEDQQQLILPPPAEHCELSIPSSSRQREGIPPPTEHLEISTLAPTQDLRRNAPPLTEHPQRVTPPHTGLYHTAPPPSEAVRASPPAKAHLHPTAALQWPLSPSFINTPRNARGDSPLTPPASVAPIFTKPSPAQPAPCLPDDSQPAEDRDDPSISLPTRALIPIVVGFTEEWPYGDCILMAQRKQLRLVEKSGKQVSGDTCEELLSLIRSNMSVYPDWNERSRLGDLEHPNTRLLLLYRNDGAEAANVSTLPMWKEGLGSELLAAVIRMGENKG
ncbi:MAG: hypothetical protein SGPRY_014164, partial [Prymnesium sp.]